MNSALWSSWGKDRCLHRSTEKKHGCKKGQKGMRESCLNCILLELNLAGEASEDLRKGYSRTRDHFSGMQVNVQKTVLWKKKISDLCFFPNFHAVNNPSTTHFKLPAWHYWMHSVKEMPTMGCYSQWTGSSTPLDQPLTKAPSNSSGSLAGLRG